MDPKTPMEQGLFLETNTVFNTQEIMNAKVDSDEFKQLIIKLSETINNVAIAVNLKDTGYYPLTEFVNGQAWFQDPTIMAAGIIQPDFRQDYRIVINFGALPNATTKTVAHGLTPQTVWSATRITCVATDPTLPAEPTPWAIPIPYVDVVGAGANNVQIAIGITNVSITTTSDMTRFTICYVTFEYLKN